ncbi:MAG: hypothetical protein LH613_07735 [Chamaesiphon sp.]|nr:hypothetical protein [Chamaesiphon sp.]
MSAEADSLTGDRGLWRGRTPTHWCILFVAAGANGEMGTGTDSSGDLDRIQIASFMITIAIEYL